MIKLKMDELNIAGQPMTFEELHSKKKMDNGKGFDFGFDNELHSDPSALDELKVVRKVQPIEQFFKPMKLTDLQRRNRIDLAKRFEDDFMYMLYWLDTYDKHYGAIPTDQVINEYVQRITKSVDEKFLNEYREELIKSRAIDFTDVTFRHRGEDWYVSPERATVLAENLSNDIHNDVDYESAMLNGKRYKKWYTVLDGKERQSHHDIDGKKIAIDDLFAVGASFMRYPRDEMFGAESAEIINCRCSLVYS